MIYSISTRAGKDITWRFIVKPRLWNEETHCSTETWFQKIGVWFQLVIVTKTLFELWRKSNLMPKNFSWAPSVIISTYKFVCWWISVKEPSRQSSFSAAPSSWGGGAHQEREGDLLRGRRCFRWISSSRREPQRPGLPSTTSGALFGSPWIITLMYIFIE